MELAQGVRHMTRVLFSLLILTVAGCATPSKDRTATGDSIAQEFRENVVKIETRWRDGTEHAGFGFIVGERAGRVYVATANHVLRGIKDPGPDTVADEIKATFSFQANRSYPGELAGVSDRDNDLGAISVPTPQGLSWRKNVIAVNRAERGDQVRFIGKLGKWEIPASPGVVKGQETPWFLVEDSKVLPGTSGAPLLSDKGLVGMVISDSVERTTGLPIRAVEDILKPHIPWQLLTRKEERKGGVPNWAKVTGGVLGAIAIGVLLGGSDENDEPTGTINVTAPIP